MSHLLWNREYGCTTPTSTQYGMSRIPASVGITTCITTSCVCGCLQGPRRRNHGPVHAGLLCVLVDSHLFHATVVEHCMTYMHEDVRMVPRTELTIGHTCCAIQRRMNFKQQTAIMLWRTSTPMQMQPVSSSWLLQVYNQAVQEFTHFIPITATIHLLHLSMASALFAEHRRIAAHSPQRNMSLRRIRLENAAANLSDEGVADAYHIHERECRFLVECPDDVLRVDS